MAESPEGGSPSVGGRGWVYCAVPGCAPSRRSDNVTTHKVPSLDNQGRPDPRRKEWLQACCIVNADERGQLRICGKHFRPEDFKSYPGSSRLIPSAVPTLNLPNPPDEAPVVQYAAEDEVVVINIDNDDVLLDVPDTPPPPPVYKDESSGSDAESQEEQGDSDWELMPGDLDSSSESEEDDTIPADLKIKLLTKKLASVKVKTLFRFPSILS